MILIFEFLLQISWNTLKLIMESTDRDVDLAMSFIRSEMGDDVHEGEKMVEVLRDQDRFLPIANVARIMKKAIPRTGKV